MFSGASNFAIAGGTFTINQTNNTQTTVLTSAFEKLSAVAAHSALHDAPARTDESRCYQHTRTNVLDNLERWAQGICEEGASIFWLHGGAGAGKSAVMQTLAERFFAQGLALGSFFFSRSDPTRNTAEVLIPTLVYQLAQLLPPSMDVLGPIIDRDPLIFKKSLQVQMLSLLVRPVQHLLALGIISNTPEKPRVFLIDGLDECSDSAHHQAIIQTLAAMCDKYCIPVKFLIASRPEHAISTSFRWYEQSNHVLGAISLSEDPDSEDDIWRFIEDQFLKICSQHPFKKMIPSNWPSPGDLRHLLWKSSSHFIYASTAIKYIWSVKENPVRSLQVVLGLEVSRTVSPFSLLDALYHHILQSAAYLDKVLQIIAHCLFSNLPSSASAVSFLLGVSTDDLFLFMADVTPLVVLSKPPKSSSDSAQDSEDVVKLLHASLGDFLRDQSRSGSLHVDEAAYLASKLEICFKLLDLHSREQPTKPDWLGNHSDESANLNYLSLKDQVMKTIDKAGHLVATQEVLRRYSLLNFHQWRLCFKDDLSGMSGVLSDLLRYFIAIHSIKTSEGATLFKSSLDDFLDILNFHISLESARLAAAIFTLILIGYPALDLCKPLSFHLGDKTSWSYTTLKSAFESLSTADITSICESVDASPERLVVAAEAILGYLFDDEIEPHSSRSRYTLQRMKEEIIMVHSLLDALIWVLPKVGVSEKIALYSTTTFRRDIYQRDDVRISRVEKCLDVYNTRVQETKLKELVRRIEIGDINALIEKSRMLDLNAQD